MLEALILTLIIETPLLMAFGLRERSFVFFSVLVNIMTNVGINVLLLIALHVSPFYYSSQPVYWVTVAILEGSVVTVEYYVYKAFLGKGGRALLLRVAAVNIVSFCLGLLVPSVRIIPDGLPDWSFLFLL